MSTEQIELLTACISLAAVLVGGKLFTKLINLLGMRTPRNESSQLLMVIMAGMVIVAVVAICYLASR